MRNWDYLGMFPENVEDSGVFYGRHGILSYAGNPLPSVLISPASQTIETYADFTLRAVTTNTITFKWQTSKDGMTWEDLEGAKDYTYSNFVQHTAGAAGTTYYRLVCHGLVGITESKPVTVTVTYRVPTISITPNTAGDFFPPHTLTITSESGFTDSRQWYHSFDGEEWEPLPGATGNRYSVTFENEDAGTHQYKCIASGLGGSKDSNIVSITILHLPPSVSIIADKVATIAPESVTITATAEYTDTYNWYHSRDGIGWERIENESAATLTITYGEADAGTHYYMCKVVGPGGEKDSNPVRVDITVPEPEPEPETPEPEPTDPTEPETETETTDPTA